MRLPCRMGSSCTRSRCSARASRPCFASLPPLSDRCTARSRDRDSILASDIQRIRVRSDFLSGVRSGVNGTPTFFINGVRFEGDWTDLEEFAYALEGAV